jgi:WhiB family redox-sensing transcriptional regulator
MTAAVVVDWRQLAACYGKDPELWHSTDPAETEVAVAVCRRCPVVADCRSWALDTGQEFGVWGGVLFAPPPPPPLPDSRTCVDCQVGYAPVKRRQVRCTECAQRRLRPAPRVECELCGRRVRVRWGRVVSHLPPGGRKGDEWCRLSGARRDPAE